MSVRRLWGRMTFDSIVALISAFAALVQAVFVVVSILYLNRQFGIVRACSYIERFNSHENICRRGAVDRWLKSSTDDESRIKAFEEDSNLQADVLGFINLFQELGVAFMRHNVHKQTVTETFDFLVPYYWNRVRFLIEYLRTQRSSPNMYRKFEFMADELSRSLS
jgi:hypothetical protein